jgi:hypothetical protein
MATYGIGENMAAVWLTTGSMTYIVSLQTIPLLMGKYIREKGLISFRKVLESIGIAASAFLLLLMAPETALGLP